MNILALNQFSSITKFATNQSQQTQPKYLPHFGLKLEQPLMQDTVSFRGTPKAMLDRDNPGFHKISKRTAIAVQREAEEKLIHVKEFMENTFGSLVVTDYFPDNIIEYLSCRTKSANSIMEKGQTRNWFSKKEMLRNMTDLNGAKIVVRDGSRKNINKILDSLKAAGEHGEAEILEIENKMPKGILKHKGNSHSQYAYATPEKLDELYNLAKTKHPSRDIKYIPTDYTDANYTAIHFLIRLPKTDTVFELQLMGHDVAKYKELDDLFYKILNGKNVDKKYKPIEDIIAPLREKGNETLKEQFNKYRSHVFLFQRKKAPHIRQGEDYNEYFLPIQNEIKADASVIKKLDVNYLYNLFLECNKK